MAKSQQRISKGFYQYSQLNKFITVKEYIFLRQDGQKCLLIRFVNDSDFAVDTMKYTVIQLDTNGNVIDTVKIEHTGLSFVPEETYATESAIVVDEYCSDFKIVFSEVRSGDYVYTVRDGQILSEFTVPPAKIASGKAKKKYLTKKHRVRRIGVFHPFLAAISPIIALILALLCICLYMTRDFIKTIPAPNAKASVESLWESSDPEKPDSYEL